MGLTRIHNTFVKLASNYWQPTGKRKTRRHSWVAKKRKSAVPSKTKLEIIDAVTGERTTAKTFWESVVKLRKWLKLRNVRAEFTEVVLKKNSTWFNLSDMEFIDYPIIVKVGTYKAPYLIKRIQDKVTYRGKTTISIQLETTDNIDYLSILSAKKELVAKKKGKK